VIGSSAKTRAARAPGTNLADNAPGARAPGRSAIDVVAACGKEAGEGEREEEKKGEGDEGGGGNRRGEKKKRECVQKKRNQGVREQKSEGREPESKDHDSGRCEGDTVRLIRGEAGASPLERERRVRRRSGRHSSVRRERALANATPQEEPVSRRDRGPQIGDPPTLAAPEERGQDGDPRPRRPSSPCAGTVDELTASSIAAVFLPRVRAPPGDLRQG